MRKFYITTAIDYVNSLPHIGTAYEKIAADCIARAKRLLGYDVRFCMGNDEHSMNVKKRALESGLDPKAYCDLMAPQFTRIWEKLAVSYDDFIRTTEPRHITGVTALFRKIRDAGDIYSDIYRGWYCEGCEAFIQEKDLSDGLCPNHQTRPSWIEERNYFFRLSRYGSRLLDHIRANPDFILPETRKNEIVRLIEGGLDDISVSRSGFDWGIPLPENPGHVVYVWFDALINYISALGYGGDSRPYERYWPADLHVIGKDITRFHCVIWPAMLMSAGEPLPRSVFGHGFIYHRGEKMSKSLGNVVSPLDIADRFGADPLRYFLLREVVFGNDGDFTYGRFIERYNSDLANDLGNLFSRVVSMIGRYFGGILPEDSALPGDALSLVYPDTVRSWTDSVERYDLSGACEALWELVRAANRRIEERAPWSLAKDPARKGELAGVLYDLACVCAGAAVLVQPYMPAAAEAMWAALALPGAAADVRLDGGAAAPKVPKMIKIRREGALFPRIEETTNMEKKTETARAMEIASPAGAAGSSEDLIDIEDFRKVDIRVGTVLAAEPVEGSSKLMRLRIDDGMSGRTILAGIATHISPEELTGRQLVFVANLKPRKMMGELSQGMVLAASEGDALFLLRPAGEVPPGARVS
jgi:methionyl-tRNA synthetase